MLSLKNPPTAIICSVDRFLLVVFKIPKKGLGIPKDISIVGYNDHDNYLSSQNVTYISHPLVEMGKMAVDILNKIDNGDIPETLSQLIEPILIEGSSDGKI